MKKKIIIISAIAVVVIGAIIGSIFGLTSLFSDDKGNSSKDESVLTSVSESSEESTKTEDESTSSEENKEESSKTESSAEETDKKGGKTKITVGTAETQKGSIVKVPVNISSNPGFMAALFNFKYDAANLKYLGYEKGDVLTDYEFTDDNGTLKFLCCENNDVKKDGLLFNIKFEVLKGSSETDIKLTVEDIVNFNEESVKVTAKSGKITAK